MKTYLIMALKNICAWLFRTKKNHTTLSDEEHAYNEWYISEQIKNYVDDETILRWEAEEVRMKDLKERSNGTTD